MHTKILCSLCFCSFVSFPLTCKSSIFIRDSVYCCVFVEFSNFLPEGILSGLFQGVCLFVSVFIWVFSTPEDPSSVYFWVKYFYISFCLFVFYFPHLQVLHLYICLYFWVKCFSYLSFCLLFSPPAGPPSVEIVLILPPPLSSSISLSPKTVSSASSNFTFHWHTILPKRNFFDRRSIFALICA